MAAVSTTWRFRSGLFPVEPQEDEATNPFRYGRALAQWVKSHFGGLGYEVEEVIAEDWGWCVMLARAPFMLWIGCGNEHDGPFFDASPAHGGRGMPEAGELTWICFVGTDAPVWTAFFWRRLAGLATTKAVERIVEQQLDHLLRETPGILLLGQDDESTWP